MDDQFWLSLLFREGHFKSLLWFFAFISASAMNLDFWDSKSIWGMPLVEGHFDNVQNRSKVQSSWGTWCHPLDELQPLAWQANPAKAINYFEQFNTNSTQLVDRHYSHFSVQATLSVHPSDRLSVWRTLTARNIHILDGRSQHVFMRAYIHTWKTSGIAYIYTYIHIYILSCNEGTEWLPVIYIHRASVLSKGRKG